MKAQLTYYNDYNQYKIRLDVPCCILTRSYARQIIWMDKQDITGLSRRDKRKFGVGLTYNIKVIALKKMKSGIITRMEVKMLGKKPVKHVSRTGVVEWAEALRILSARSQQMPTTGSIDVHQITAGSIDMSYEAPDAR